jgi:hypothetical protein
MIVLRRLSYVLLLSFVPMGCTEQSAPPVAPKVDGPAATSFGTTPETPKPVVKGKRQIHPGGSGTVEP